MYTFDFSIAPNPPVLIAVFSVNSTSIIIQWNMPTVANGALTSYTILYSVDNSSLLNKTVLFNGQLVCRMKHAYVIYRSTHILDSNLHHCWIASLSIDHCYCHCNQRGRNK